MAQTVCAQTVCRGIRGATTAEVNTPEAILAATRELLVRIAAENEISPEEIASIFFTVTPDLDAEYPAVAARNLGWSQVPLLNSVEIPRVGGLPACIRVLFHVNTTKKQNEIKHIYLREAVRLRPDLASEDSEYPQHRGGDAGKKEGAEN
ncbi:MAG: chorismate mutase [Firmicutes bacterium]|nr:chorismate mutase [Bacillota bacterium]